jgi:hypothetical protein
VCVLRIQQRRLLERFVVDRPPAGDKWIDRDST